METLRYIEQWCDDAVSYIRFQPDRPPVRQELLEHMQDKYNGYLAQGLSAGEAERRTVREMGAAGETGVLLRKVHKPYLGWLWRTTQWVLVIALIVAAVSGVRWGKDLTYDEAIYEYFDPFAEGVYETGNIRLERVLDLKPDSSATCCGYTFTVTEVAGWKGTREYFCVRMEVTNPRPWADSTDAPYWLSAVDSAGNAYLSFVSHASGEDEMYIWGNRSHARLRTDTWDLRLENYVDCGADWLDLCYDRGGECFTIRIDLKGGGGA